MDKTIIKNKQEIGTDIRLFDKDVNIYLKDGFHIIGRVVEVTPNFLKILELGEKSIYKLGYKDTPSIIHISQIKMISECSFANNYISEIKI